MTHEEAEVAIGMRQHGALDAAGCAALDGHLAACAPCRRFEQTSMNTEMKMQAHALEELSHVNWINVEARLVRIRAENRHLVPRAAVGLVALSLALAWIYDLQTALLAALFGAGICAMFAVMVHRRGRELTRAAESQGELLAFYRNQLARGLENTRLGRWFLPALSVLWFVTAIALAVTGHPVKQIVYQLAIAVYLAGWAVHVRREHARLVRERDELV